MQGLQQNFQASYTYLAYSNGTNDMIVKLLKEGCGIRGISRILNISCGTVLSRMLSLAKLIKTPYFMKQGCKFEIDELFVRITNGRSQNYLTYAIEQESRKVIGFIIGSRSTENIRPLVNKVLLLNPVKIYTDRLHSYKNLIPTEVHSTVKYQTNRIERKNLTLRTHIKRLVRKTICYSKSEVYLEAHLRIYLWG